MLLDREVPLTSTAMRPMTAAAVRVDLGGRSLHILRGGRSSSGLGRVPGRLSELQRVISAFGLPECRDLIEGRGLVVGSSCARRGVFGGYRRPQGAIGRDSGSHHCLILRKVVLGT